VIVLLDASYAGLEYVVRPLSDVEEFTLIGISLSCLNGEHFSTSVRVSLTMERMPTNQSECSLRYKLR